MSCASPVSGRPHPRASVALRLERRGTSRLASSSSSPSGSVARLGVVASAGGRPRDRVVDRDALVAIQSAFERPAVPLKDGATVTLRPMRESDVRALTAVMVDAFRGTPDERPRARVAKYLLDQLDPDPDEICLVAVFDDAPDEPVAIAYFSELLRANHSGRTPGAGRPQAEAPAPPDAPYLCNMAVANEHRGRGVAKALLSACDFLAREMGHQDVWLHVRSSDVIAVGLYRSSGYDEAAGGRGGGGDGGGFRDLPFVKMFGGGGDDGGVVLMRKAL